MHGELDEAVGVAPLVVVPRNELDEVVSEHDASAGIEDGGALVALEVRGHELLIGVAHDAHVLGRLRLGLDQGLDLVVRSLLAELAREVHHRHVGCGHTEGHAGELAVEGGEHLADSLGSTSGGGDDVLARAAAAAPVLARGAVHGLLRGGGGVHSGHETLHDAVLLVDDLSEGRKAVGGARGVGEDVDVLGVRGVVHAHHEHGGVSGGGGDDHLLGAALEVEGGLLHNSEDASGLAHDVSPRSAPRHLVGVAHGVELDLLAIDDELGGGLIVGHAALVDAVGGVVLKEVGSVLDVAEGIVDGDNIAAVLLAGGAAHEAANAAEARDTHLGRHV
mmetsp:Transcript_6214/g.16870  ORF Transcript_6214/g.16870 Transcript_6214/m.16870 type:complete len:334 (+) Transcript_6214:333-1334(+)